MNRWVFRLLVLLVPLCGFCSLFFFFVGRSEGQAMLHRAYNTAVDTVVRRPDVGTSQGSATPADAGPEAVTRMCTQEERLTHMKRWCDKYGLTRPALLNPAQRSYVDYNHRLVFCWMSKSGCTSLKAFIMEANGLSIKEKSFGDSLNLVHFDNIINKYGVKRMTQLNETERRYVVSEFYTTFAIRHPFDRILAYYRDKIVDTDRSSNHPKRVAEILHKYRPKAFENNATLGNMTYPQESIGPPTFLEFITWFYDAKMYDEHWAFISECCHPCAHHWDAMLRIETMTMDGQILADRLNVSYNSIPRRHSHEPAPQYNVFHKQLEPFKDASPAVIDYILDMFKLDMNMFGYKWDKKTYTQYCAIETPNGVCC